MRGPRLVPWLLACGLIVATFALTWQGLEERGRAPGGRLRVPEGLSWRPDATLVARIQETWVPGDRLRTGLLLVGLGLCAVGVWRAWRVEGLPAATLRRVGLVLAIVGAACLLLALVRGQLHESEWSCDAYLEVGPDQHMTGYEQALGTESPPGMAPLGLLGAVLLGMAPLLGLAALLYPPRARRHPREPASTP